jgi:serine/threonine-protein kinase
VILSSATSSNLGKSGALGETRVSDVLLEVEQAATDARVWFETEYGMGEVLFHRGQMVKARLGGARGQTALLRLLAINEGKYSIEHCSVAEDMVIVQDVKNLIELHNSRKAEWKELCGSAPPLSSVLRLTASGADVRDSSRGIQRVILVLIDGRRTLMQVLEESSFDPVEALKIVTKALDDDLAQIAPQATSLFPLAPAGDASGVLPRFVPPAAVPRLDPMSPGVEPSPPTWRHATLVGLGIKSSASSNTGDEPAKTGRAVVTPASDERSERVDGLAPAPIIDISRRSAETLGADVGRGPDVNSLVKTVIGFDAGGTKGILEASPKGPLQYALGRTAKDEAPRQRIVDISPDSATRPQHGPPAGPTSLSSEYTAAGPTAEGQRRYIDRYEILLRIGRGGMGTVYLARLSSSDVGFRRLFAVKLLRSHLSLDTQAAKDFLEEAKIAGYLHHANVVAVYDAGFHGKQPYLVMEYVEGCSLKQLTHGVANRSPYFLLPIVIDALAGLQAAHTLQDELGVELKLVHCDVSPENMLVGVDGTCRLTDFGMARKANRVPGATTRGKPSYVAPEQVTGKTFDHRADIFSMGVVLWGALTGKRLFAGETVEETIAQVCSKRIVPPCEAGAQSFRELDDIVMRALSRDPNDRFESAEEMMTALGRAAAKQQGLATPKEIASWVRDAAGTELTQRRLAILDASRNNPTIPPAPDDGARAVAVSASPVQVAREPLVQNTQFRSSSAPPAGSERSNAPPAVIRSDSDISAFFYGSDDSLVDIPRSARPAQVRAVPKTPRTPLQWQVIVKQPWVMVSLLALVVTVILILLVRSRSQ